MDFIPEPVSTEVTVPSYNSFRLLFYKPTVPHWETWPDLE